MGIILKPLKPELVDFFGGPMVKNPLANTGTQVLSWSGRPHAMGQLSPCKTSHRNKKPTHSNEDPVQPKINN